MSILLPWSWDSDPEIVKQAITVGSVSNPKPLSLLGFRGTAKLEKTQRLPSDCNS